MTSGALTPPALTKEERQSETNRMLAEARHAPPAVRQQLIDDAILLNISVARTIASRYYHRGIPVEDVDQVACLALVRAANRFDPAKAEDFLTYAVPSIRGEVRRYFRDHGWTVRPPRRVQELQTLINQDFGGGHSSTVAPEEVAARLGVAVGEVRDALAAQGCFHPTSLDAPARENGEPLGQTLGETLVDDEFDQHAAVEARVILRTLTKDLTPRERLILYLRFIENRTQQEIGQEIGVTQMQVSRLLAGIMGKMRDRALADGETQIA